MKQLWAPWRMAYIGGHEEKKPGCFFCDAWNDLGREEEHLLLFRKNACFIMLNRYPYSNGHLMVAPSRHIGTMDETTDAEGVNLWQTTILAKKALQRAFNPDGFNIGINQGKVAGAGVLDHLHIHIVPRWNGDVNFMPVLADIRVIPEALKETRKKILPFFES